jgi:hypothetical protein
MRTLLILLSIAIIFLPSGQISAYDDETTHPALTQEIVEFYNLLHPENKITPEEKEFIVSGSIEEDEWPRWLNHFYDPVYKSGWTGEKTGNVPSFIARALSAVGLSTAGSYSAVNWVNNVEAQKQYSNYGGDHTWKTGLEHFAKGDTKNAYINLGHALHLLEDMSVPDHSRNDTHAPLGGDEGSPFEDYLRKWTREEIKSLNFPAKLLSSKATPPAFATIEDYLIDMATYSNKYFFSKDTINDPKYQFPKIVRDDGNYGYGIDENGREFPLVRVKTLKIDGEFKKVYSLDSVKEEKILDAYFSRLAPKVILYGAGVIDLFKKQAEDEIVKREYPVRLVRYDFSFLTPKTFSLAAEGRKLFNAAQTILANVTKTAASAFGAIGSIIQNETKTKVSKTPAALPAPAEPATVSEINQPAVTSVTSEVAAAISTEQTATEGGPLRLVEAPANQPAVKRVENLPGPWISQNTNNVVSVSVYSSPTPIVNGLSNTSNNEPVYAVPKTNTTSTPTASSTESVATSTEETATSTAISTESTATSTEETTISTEPAATSTATSTEETATSTATSTESAATSTEPTATSTESAATSTEPVYSIVLEHAGGGNIYGFGYPGNTYAQGMAVKLAQRFIPSSSFNLHKIIVRIGRFGRNGGNHVDGVKLSIYTNVSINCQCSVGEFPGSLVAESTNEVSYADMAYVVTTEEEFTFPPTALKAGDKYWIVFERTGEFDWTNIYGVEVAVGNFADADIFRGSWSTGSAWDLYYGSLTAFFRIYGVK